jgi:DNA polymerase-3 subunit gamma/tau
MSLYLKYRPQDFKSIVGQEQVKDILKAEVEQNKINSSYIFFWPRWTWKTSTARIFAKAINCTWEGEKPCNSCEACQLINSWKTLDFVEIDAASNTQVDKIREEIIDKAIYPPTNLQKKVYIIDEVHMLSKSAFNALLKIMEEPPEYLIFILATTEIHKVPETIVSRCEVFNFKRIPQEKIVERLKYIAENENIDYDEEWLKLIAKISDGWLRDAIKYLEQVSIVWKITAENVSKFLWIAPERQIQDFLDLIKSSNLNEIFKFIDNLQNNWIDLTNFIKDVLAYLDEHLEENIEANLKLINLLDEVYQNIKNFPAPALAYKTILWLKLTQNTEIKAENKKQKAKTEKFKSGDIKWKIEKEKIEDDNQSLSIQNQPQSLSITKEDLLKHISSPIVKWIIKNFWHIEQEWNLLKIIIISQTNYTILNQEDKIKSLLEDIYKTYWEDIKVDIQYMPKEEFFEKQLKD